MPGVDGPETGSQIVAGSDPHEVQAMAGRTLAIGDIHGCDYALDALLNLVAPTRDDTVVVLGDVVDRGPGSRQVIERLLALRATCEVVLILGNHDETMLGAIADPAGLLRGWLSIGGNATLFSYGGPLASVPPQHVEFLRSGIDLFPTATEIFVHANLKPGIPLYEQHSDWLRWTSLEETLTPWEDGRRVVCGHSHQRSHVPRVESGWVCIDTSCCRGGWLSALDVASDTVYQANDRRQVRQFPLSESAAYATPEAPAEAPLPTIPGEDPGPDDEAGEPPTSESSAQT